ncbi:hypothetical protein FACS18948_5260 [Clostridia bacterium]|nr:hypothetical protein FACS18948_5260 [Clostridia bacterium]
MGLPDIFDYVVNAFEYEQERNRWDEWCAFVPVMAIMGKKAITFEQYKSSIKPKETATNNDINDIRRRFGI